MGVRILPEEAVDGEAEGEGYKILITTYSRSEIQNGRETFQKPYAMFEQASIMREVVRSK
jgi:hypothetical protein